MFDKPEVLREIAYKAGKEARQRKQDMEFERRIQQIKDRIHMASCRGKCYVNVPNEWVSPNMSDMLTDAGYYVRDREKCDRETGDGCMDTYIRIAW
jgi:hypothetical protein